jgi:hypothetical protein
MYLWVKDLSTIATSEKDSSTTRKIYIPLLPKHVVADK